MKLGNLKLYLDGLKDIGKGSSNDERILEGNDSYGNCVKGFFHKNYIFRGMLEVEFPNEKSLSELLKGSNYIDLTPCGGGFYKRDNIIRVKRNHLYIKSRRRVLKAKKNNKNHTYTTSVDCLTSIGYSRGHMFK